MSIDRPYILDFLFRGFGLAVCSTLFRCGERRGHVKLALYVAEFFKIAESVNEASRRVMREMQDAA